MGFKPDIETGWCASAESGYHKFRADDDSLSSPGDTPRFHKESQEQGPSSSPDIKVYWANHQPEMCTVCQLYQQYFGEHYPRHSI